jgi:hypothetical protein
LTGDRRGNNTLRKKGKKRAHCTAEHGKKTEGKPVYPATKQTSDKTGMSKIF